MTETHAVAQAAVHRPALRRRQPLKTTWFSRLEGAVEDAVRSLPDLGGCPRELYLSALAVNHAADGGRTALVERAGHPVAVIALRRTGALRWRNFTNSVIPGFVTAAADEDLLPAFRALRVEVDVSWWHRSDIPASPQREHHVVPQYRLAVAEREAYWKAHHKWSNLRAARNRCADLELVIDAPGDSDWVVRSSARKWADRWDASQEASLQLSLEVARHFEAAGEHTVLTLRRDGVAVTGITALRGSDGVWVASRTYRDAALGKLPTGDRIIDALFDHAEAQGALAVDLGGSYGYKAHWAPEFGARHDFLIGPAWSYGARRIARRLARRG
ncbi:hypothetical protein GCM10022286_18320 [Gryllotalpicola daejeonensis]|uniref:BioF2-like acetyltransferase domain-containing protein n=1 Tax=Gryllotalpicola daejeonensis TaxID=993087 RepID=A0ABP7ZK64_9MICO